MGSTGAGSRHRQCSVRGRISLRATLADSMVAAVRCVGVSRFATIPVSSSSSPSLSSWSISIISSSPSSLTSASASAAASASCCSCFFRRDSSSCRILPPPPRRSRRSVLVGRGAAIFSRSVRHALHALYRPGPPLLWWLGRVESHWSVPSSYPSGSIFGESLPSLPPSESAGGWSSFWSFSTLGRRGRGAAEAEA